MTGSKFSSKKEFLDYLHYDVGKQSTNFRLACAYKDDDGAMKWSEWKNYLDVQGDEKFIENANNRTLLNNEIVLDIDPKPDESKEDIEIRYNALWQQFDKDNLKYNAFFSGSRGFHFHLIFPELVALDKTEREKVREIIIEKYDCDIQKKSDNCMIALEYTAHFKTDNPKTLLHSVEGENSLSQIPEVTEYFNQRDWEKETEEEEHRILNELDEKAEKKGLYCGDFAKTYAILKELSKRRFHESEAVNFIIGNERTICGKITHKLHEFPIKIRLCWSALKETHDDELLELFFLDDRFDGRKWEILEEVCEEFWIYEVNVSKRKFWLFSQEELALEEYFIKGMLVECDDLARIGLNKRIRTVVPLFFVFSYQQRIIKYISHEELFNDIKQLSLTEDKFFNFLFSKPDGKSYRHPQYFERMIGAFLFSGKRNAEDYPLHLLLMAKQGTGKTYLEEAIHAKFYEQQEIVEGSGITMKKLVPSFKDVKAEAGAFAEANRLCTVDEFLRVLMRSRPEDRENHLTMLNPLLEHKKREFGSGNSSITIKPTAKLLAVSNPVYGTSDMVNLCEKIDNSFLSRVLIFFQDEEHIKWVQEGRGIENAEFTMEKNLWLSICDYFQTFTCSYDKQRVEEVFSFFPRFLSDKVLDIYSRRYKQHHIHLLMDGIVKLRCLTYGDVSFAAIEEDYNTLLLIWRTMIINWTGEKRISSLPSIQEKLKYVTREEKYILETLSASGRIRDTEVYELDCPDPMFHMIKLQESGIVVREGHYFLINTQSELGDHEKI